MVTIPVDCMEVFRQISTYLDGDIEPAVKARMEAHFKVCAHCTAVLDGMRNIVRIAGDGESFAVPPGFSQRLYRKVAAHIDKKKE